MSSRGTKDAITDLTTPAITCSDFPHPSREASGASETKKRIHSGESDRLYDCDFLQTNNTHIPKCAAGRVAPVALAVAR